MSNGITSQTITVSWNGTNIVTTPTTITGSNTVTLTWAAGTGVSTINNITTPTAPDNSTLNAPTLSASGAWSMVDWVNPANTYNYTMTINNSITQDPEIVNDPPPR